MEHKLSIGKGMRLSMRFALMVGTIVCAFCAGSAVLLYAYGNEQVIEDTYESGQIVFTLMDGIGAYVGSTLRPKRLTLLSHVSEEDGFVAKAMSTTRIRLASWTTWRRRSLSFSTDAYPSRPGMLKIYGSQRGFGYLEGDLMGEESISISLSAALKETQDIAIQVSTIGFCAMLLLFVAIEDTFLRLVGQPLQRLTARFDDIAGGSHLLGQEVPVQSMDEIGELTRSFNTMAHPLAEAQETLQSYADILQSIIDGISDPLAWRCDRGRPVQLARLCQQLPEDQRKERYHLFMCFSLRHIGPLRCPRSPNPESIW